MTDALDRVVADLHREDPEFRAEYDRLQPRHQLIKRIIRARVDRDWTQRDLAAAAGMKQPAIARLERGDTDPRWSTVVIVCSALDLPLVVGGDERIAG